MKNYKLISRPAKWVSAHRANRFKFRLPQTTINSGYNAGGFLKLNFAGAFPYPMAEGDRIYIPAGTDYTGYHTIKTVHSSVQITLDTPYTSSIGGAAVIWLVYLPTVRIYKGYELGDLTFTYEDGTLDLSTIQPYELVGTFRPEPDLTGYINFDICAYLQTVIDTPYKGAYSPDEVSHIYEVNPFLFYTPKYYNRVQVILADTLISEHFAANAAITTDELNRNFVDTGRQMQPLEMPVKYFDTYYIADYIEGDFIKAKITS